ncbi:MAG TPA: glycosyltransferase family 1 protein [Planctomycetes bacterium]|nr:glycosyltransferase family 1 protein [Planctomycetota bacterium]
MSKLLLLCEFPTLAGGERSMLAILPHVRRAGFSVEVLAPPTGPLAEALCEQAVPVVPFGLAGPSGRRLPQRRLRDQLREHLLAVRPDLLHANSLAMARLAGPVTAETGVPGLGHLRDIVRLSRQAVTDLNRLDRLLAVSEATRRFHLAGGVSAEKTFVAYNGVDVSRFAPRRRSGFLHAELGLAPKARLVGAVGQISLRKGLDVIVEAACRVVRRARDVHFVVAGQRWSEKPESRALEAELCRMTEATVPGRFHWLGYRRDIPRLLGELALLVHAARQEPLGRVLLEAAACGVPIVATAVGGTPEIFPPESGSARLVPPDDPARLADVILELLADPEGRCRMGAEARRQVEKRFTAHQAARQLMEHYRQLLAG